MHARTNKKIWAVFITRREGKYVPYFAKSWYDTPMGIREYHSTVSQSKCYGRNCKVLAMICKACKVLNSCIGVVWQVGATISVRNCFNLL